MDLLEALQRVAQPLGDSVRVDAGPAVTILNAGGLRQRIGALVESAVFGKEPHRSLARWLIRELAIAAGAPPGSIQELYLARGRGETRELFHRAGHEPARPPLPCRPSRLPRREQGAGQGDDLRAGPLGDGLHRSASG